MTLPQPLHEAARRSAKALFSLVDGVQRPIAGPRILIFHQVGAGHGYQLDVHVDTFRAQVAWLDQNFDIVHLDDALQESNLSAADQMIVLTFDDGYRDVFTNAFPTLAERSIPFTLYLTTEPIESGQPLHDRPSSDPIRWDEVNAMLTSGLLTVGAHTHSHPDLRTVDRDHIASDLAEADRIIEERTGRIPIHFAYPYGYWAPAAHEIVRERYTSAALGATTSAAPPGDLHRLARVPIQLSDGTAFFKRKVLRGSRSEERVRRLLTGYRGP